MKRTTLSLAALMLGLAALFATTAISGPVPATFPFVVPWDDASPGTATDVTFLNAGPAGTNGYIVVKDGHFIQSKNGQRIQFLGTNFAAGDAFPSHDDAEKVAARIAKLGINLVRLHHMDNSDWGQPQSIWDYGYQDRQHISAAQLDRLDYLIAQFKKNGIYVNINLHVSRQFTAADGFPASVSLIPTSFDKRVDEFDRRMILLQKKYAHDLLTHVNPYTGLSYADDPAVAVIEINNENSLVGDPWAGFGAGLDSLPDPFRAELAGEWNVWLGSKYGNDARLQAAWLKGLTATGPQINSEAQWTVESQGDSKASMTQGMGADDTPAPYATVSIPQIDGTSWHVQVHQVGLDLKSDATYTVTFKAKADAPREMPVGATLDEADWHNVGLDATAAVTTDWKAFRYVFTAHDAVPGHVRIAFTLGNQTGTVSISDLKIHPGAEGAGLQPGESLSRRSVGIPAFALRAQNDDWIAFLADTEREYAEEMRGYLKGTLHVHANIICSQISWGGLTGLNRETRSDFADNHAYWQHPSFPHKQWDPVDWNIQNTPMVADLAAGGGGTLRDLAEYRIARKPYSISEYNHPAPSDFRAEMMPEYATFAAFQDWDIIYLFDYGAYGTGADNDKINSYFGISSDPTKTAFLPGAAMIFRAREFGASEEKSTLNLWPGDLEGRLVQPLWQKNGTDTAPNIFRDKLTVDLHQPSGSTVPETGVGTEIGTGVSKSTIRVVTTAAGPQYLADSPSAQAAAGYVGGETVALGANSLTFPAFGNNFAAVTLTAMDEKTIATSHRLLLALVGKVENQNMGWNAARTSVGDQWGTGPTMAEGIPATITIKNDLANSVWALDSSGHRAVEVPSNVSNGLLTFTVGPQYKTLWYEVGVR